MALTKYHIIDLNENSPIYLRVFINKGETPTLYTGINIDANDWSFNTSLPLENSFENINLNKKLTELKTLISSSVKEKIRNGETVCEDWVKDKMDNFFESYKVRYAFFL